MIAELFEPFQDLELNRKIAYHLGKIEKGVAENYLILLVIRWRICEIPCHWLQA